MAEGELVVEIIEEAPPPLDDETPAPSNMEQWLGYPSDLLFCIVAFLLFIVFIPFYVLYVVAAWLFLFNHDVYAIKDFFGYIRGPQGPSSWVYLKVVKMIKKLDAAPIKTRLTIFGSSWLIVSLSHPGLRNKLVLGSKLWKWTLLFVIVLYAYGLIHRLNVIFINVVRKSLLGKSMNCIYYLEGMRQSVNLVALSTFLLVMWMSYFRTSHGLKKTKETDKLLNICTWSLVTFAVSAVLWTLKTALLLKWQADAVYSRFYQRIIILSTHAYFLKLICQFPSGFSHFKDEEDKEKIILEGIDVDDDYDIKEEEKETSRSNKQESRKATSFLLAGTSIWGEKKTTLHNVQKMATYLVDQCKISPEDDDDNFIVQKECMKIIRQGDPDIFCVEVEDLVHAFDLDRYEAEILLYGMKREYNSRTVLYKNFEKSMVRARTNIIALGRTLSDAKEVVRVLNNVMVSIVFIIAFITWLLLTDIANTKILIVLASPLLAATFMFGDTCKRMFEGIIFCFINHPFDVGDLCIIDKTELEVIGMSVLKTTFVAIGTNEKILYPNSALASIPITHLGGAPDPGDSLEITLDPDFTNSMLQDIHTGIKGFFQRDNRIKDSKTIVTKVEGKGMKLEVQFNHALGIQITTHAQCYEMKREQKTHLLVEINELMEQYALQRNKYLGKETPP